MQSFTFVPGRLHPGITLFVMSAAIKAFQKAHPRATFRDLMEYTVLHWPSERGPGTLTVERDGQAPETLCMPQKVSRNEDRNTVVVALPCVLRFRPEEGSGLTVRITRSGASAQIEGADAEAPAVLPDPPNATPLERTARAWLRDGHVGASSYALCVELTGVSDPRLGAPNFTDVPWDVDDFQRCQGFFQAVPEALPMVSRMANQGRFWAALAPVWPELQEGWDAGDRDAVANCLNRTLRPLRGASLDAEDSVATRKPRP